MPLTQEKMEEMEEEEEEEEEQEEEKEDTYMYLMNQPQAIQIEILKVHSRFCYSLCSRLMLLQAVTALLADV